MNMETKWHILALFRSGMDSVDIAKMLGWKESEVVEVLAALRRQQDRFHTRARETAPRIKTVTLPHVKFLAGE